MAPGGFAFLGDPRGGGYLAHWAGLPVVVKLAGSCEGAASKDAPCVAVVLCQGCYTMVLRAADCCRMWSGQAGLAALLLGPVLQGLQVALKQPKCYWN
jgi:hypothetical protein